MNNVAFRYQQGPSPTHGLHRLAGFRSPTSARNAVAAPNGRKTRHFLQLTQYHQPDRLEHCQGRGPFTCSATASLHLQVDVALFANLWGRVHCATASVENHKFGFRS